MTNPCIVALLAMAALNGVWDGATTNFKRPKTVCYADGTYSFNKTWITRRFAPQSVLFTIELVLMVLSGLSFRQLLVPTLAACAIMLATCWLVGRIIKPARAKR